MEIQKFNLHAISRGFKKAWDPQDVAGVADTVVRIAKFEGEYHWHKHDNEDELFIVFKGGIKVQTRNGDIVLEEGEGVKIPKGTEHCPVALEPSYVLMIEPSNLDSKGR